MTPEQRFAELLRQDGSRPFVTYYDEATGERSELSRKSLANWVAKTYFLLTDELALDAGDGAVVALPAHWISVPVLLGCLSAGLQFVDDDAPVGFLAPETLTAGDRADDRYVIAPSSAAVGLRDQVPDGMADYVLAVRPQADSWAGVRFPATDADPVLPGVTRGELDRRAAERAADLGLAAGGRLVTSRPWTSHDDWIDALLAPLSVGGSVVIVAHADEATVARRGEQERATAVLT